jgi:hypothetical protein
LADVENVRRSRARRRMASATIVALAGIASLSQTFPAAASDGSRLAPAYPSSFYVGIRGLTFVDTSRPTLDYATEPPTVVSNDRSIFTEVRYPTLTRGTAPQLNAAPARQYGPFPVVVFAHGYAETPSSYEPLLDSWVRAGFVVVAPLFPVDNYWEWRQQGGGSAPEQDIWNEPRDVAYVMHELVAVNSSHQALLRGLFDFFDMAFAGQSDGATVMGGLVYGERFRFSRSLLPARPVATGLFSGAEFWDGVVYSDPSPDPAVLSIQSDADYCNPSGDAVGLHAAAALHTKSRWFLVLHGADHIGPYTADPPWTAVVERVSTDYFELALRAKGHTMTAAELEAAGSVAGVSSESEADVISMVATADLGECGTPSPYPPR